MFVPSPNFLLRMADKDRRVEFIQEYTLKSMRLKADKWNKIIIFDEQRQYLQVQGNPFVVVF